MSPTSCRTGDPMETKERVRILKTEVLSDDWYVLRKVTFDFQRRDGAWQRQSRETYDRGNGATPEERIRVEVEEETGYRVHHVEKIFEAFMSPGSVTEKLYFYIGDYDGSMRVSAGGGVEDEGEEIETIEVPLQ